jgi:hypothetical protein
VGTRLQYHSGQRRNKSFVRLGYQIPLKVAKDFITKEKISDFNPLCQKDQLSAPLETEEHRGRTRVVSSIASWKEGFTEDIHMYKKHGRHDIDAESINNKEQFATLFFNFMRKHPDIVISEVSVPQINLDISTALL